ncbi:MAG: acyl-CoA/acyl-ACP dehydrogenase [Gammaproteobacteria bacterium]|nr:acyl-CoA/acyl-ACP dehydrogenase [Gammaproteobacteria bacterium]
MGIDLQLSEEQELIGTTANEFFGKYCPPELVREYETGASDFPGELWSRMAELGWLGMPFPERHGGLGLAMLDMIPLYVELGRHLVPCPLLDTAALAGGLISALGSEDQKKELLGGIARGESVITPAIMEPDGGYGPEAVQLEARPDGSQFVLSGTKVLVACARSADKLLCAARTATHANGNGITLFLVDPRAAGATIERMPNIAGYPLYAVTFDRVSVPREALVGDPDAAWPTLYETTMKAAVLQSAMVVGAGERVLAMTTDYAREREQFGQAIGRSQAVQSLCTDIAIHCHWTRLLTLQAAWRIDSGRRFFREAALAKASASRGAAAMTFAAHEVHAGIAFVVDYDLQLYTRRAKHWEYNLGDLRYHLDRACAESGL